MFKVRKSKTFLKFNYLALAPLMLVMFINAGCSGDRVDVQQENILDDQKVEELQTIQEPQFSARELIFNVKNNTVTLKGEVSFKTEFIEFEDAEEVIWDKNLNEVYVSGMRNFSIDGGIVASGNPTKNIVRHKLNERVAYME